MNSYLAKLTERKFLLLVVGSVYVYVAEPDPHQRTTKLLAFWAWWIGVEAGVDITKIKATAPPSVMGPVASVTNLQPPTPEGGS